VGNGAVYFDTGGLHTKLIMICTSQKLQILTCINMVIIS
jgi:hypothetical protein